MTDKMPDEILALKKDKPDQPPDGVCLMHGEVRGWNWAIDHLYDRGLIHSDTKYKALQERCERLESLLTQASEQLSKWSRSGLVVYDEIDNSVCCCDTVEQAELIIDRVNSYRWEPIDTAPTDGTEVLVTDGVTVSTAVYRKSNVLNYAPFFCKSIDGNPINFGRDWEQEWEYIYEPTHWMPLPEQPSKGDG